MLCTACQHIFRGRQYFSGMGGEDHHLTAQSFAQAVSQNCYICTSLYWRYRECGVKRGMCGPLQSTEESRVMNYSVYAVDDHSISLSIFLHEPRSHISSLAWNFTLVEAELSRKTCQFAPDTASEPCWKLAKYWLSSCLTNHMRCRKFLSASPYHPTRLIEVAPLASAFDDELHLRIDGEHSPEVPYMTLSHRWGESQFLKLTKETSQRLRDGFSGADTLSKTFQDAITICRELGVKYLWIDSLCIFQDSPDDWRREAAQMGQVYENSLCNIAATGGPNDEEGCFRDREVSLVQRFTIKSQWDNHKNGTWEIMDNDFWDTHINQAPLNQRGWVMQERWLSPRVLHYGRDQILWECSELDACETYPDGLPKPLRSSFSGFKLHPELLKLLEYEQLDEAPMSDPVLLYPSTWAHIVNKYSATSLTKGEDKLVAVSGIAKRMQKILEDEYLAGLWKKDLPYQLLWQVNSFNPANKFRLTTPRHYRAPSWSWASVEAEVVSCYGNYNNIFVTVLDAGVTPLGEDSTGQIKDGFIRLNGKIFPARLIEHNVSPTNFIMRVDSYRFKGSCSLDIDSQGLHFLDFYYLPIRSYNAYSSPHIDGLMLQAAPQGNGAYERIGVYYLFHEESCSAFESLYENANGETIVLI